MQSAVELPTADGPRGLPPLRRRPKKLDAAPAVFRAGSGPPVVVDVDGDRGTGDLTQDAGGQGALVTAQRAVQRDVAELLEDRPPDPQVAAMAHAIARRLSIRRRAREARGERGSGRLVSMPYRYRSDDIDLDRTLEVLTERPVPEDTDIVVRERVRARRAVVLIVDVSGSMRGEKTRMTAATVAALATDLSGGGGDQLALVAFWSDAALLTPLAVPATAAEMLDRLLRVPARGLTNVGFGLTVGLAELLTSAVRRRTAVLLTDSVHNAGPDPRLVARRFPELHVLLQVDGEHDAELGADIARLGRGRMARVRTHRDVAPALNRLLT